ncbi:hypothetical protein SASC598J21_002680, partial [Snodgrassella alvi SCGC AB-598-J21]
PVIADQLGVNRKAKALPNEGPLYLLVGKCYAAMLFR